MSVLDIATIEVLALAGVFGTVCLLFSDQATKKSGLNMVNILAITIWYSSQFAVQFMSSFDFAVDSGGKNPVYIPLENTVGRLSEN